MTDDLCVICHDRPAHGAYACVECVDQARRLLADIGDMAVAARDVAQRQAVRGSGSGSGKPGSSLPLGLEATSRLIGTYNALRAWSAQIAAERGILPALILPHEDPITTVSEWLSGHTEWIRHLGETANQKWITLYARDPDDAEHNPGEINPDIPPYIAAQFAHAVNTAHRVVRGLAAGPRERIYLGPCGAPTEAPGACPVDCGCHRGPQYPCTEPGGCGSAGCGRPAGNCAKPLYGRLGARKAVCKDCGAEHDVDQRIAERTALAHSYRYTAAEIADAYPHIPASTIRSWRKRGQLVPFGEHDGRPLYELARVLELAESRKQGAEVRVT